MVILIIASNQGLSDIWKRHLERQGHTVSTVGSQQEAVSHLDHNQVDVIVLDVMLKDGSAIAVADYASYRAPGARVVSVSNSTFFSDGSIFEHIPNASAQVNESTPLNDLAAIVEYHGKAS